MGGKYSWVLGVGFGVLSSVFTAVGTLLQKKAHTKNAQADVKAKELGGLLLTWDWVMAFCFQVLVPVPLDIVALGQASASIIAPMAGVTICASQVLAVFILGEVLTRRLVAGTALLIVGVVLTTLNGSHNDSTYSADDLWSLTKSLEYSLLPNAVVGGLVGACFLGLKVERLEYARPVLYAFIAGALGGMNNLLLKNAAEIAASGDGWFSVFFWLNLVALIGMSISQLSMLNIGLKKHSAVIFLPIYNSFFVICTVTLGGLFYGEFDDFTPVHSVLFISGIGLCLLGIVVVNKEPPASSSPLIPRNPSPALDPSAPPSVPSLVPPHPQAPLENGILLKDCETAVPSHAYRTMEDTLEEPTGVSSSEDLL